MAGIVTKFGFIKGKYSAYNVNVYYKGAYALWI